MTLRVLDAAEREVADAFDYYESQSQGLGRRLAGEIRDALARILDFPEAHPIFDPAHRKRNLKKFPYRNSPSRLLAPFTIRRKFSEECDATQSNQAGNNCEGQFLK